MATKTSPSRRSSSRASTSRTTKSRSTSGSTKGRAAAKTPPKTPYRQILSPWARDALGIALVVVALLSVLSVWFDAAGLLGRGLTWALRGLLGVAAITFPLVGLYWGVVLLRDIAREDRVRMFIGFSVFGLGLLGIISLAAGNPGPMAG